MMNIRSLTFQVVALVAIPAFAEYHKPTDYEFTFSSFAREGAMTLHTEGEAKGTYTLGHELTEKITWPNGRTSKLETPLFDKQVSLDALVGEDGLLAGEALRPISYVPNDLTVTAVSIVTPGDLAPETLTLTVDGKAYTLSPTDETEAVTLRGTWDNVAGTRSGTVHTYAPKGAAIALAGADASFTVAFPATDASGQQQNRTVYCVDGRPFLRIAGTAEITHHVFKIDQQASAEPQSLAALLEGESESFKDDANTVVVVDFEGDGGAIDLDATIESSPLIFGSAVEPEQAAIHFRGGAKITSPLTFRDGATPGGTTRSGVSVYGPDPTDDQPLVWDPAALLLLCDATLKTTLPTRENGWFATHAVPIPAGRTFRIELDEEVADFDALPNLSFAAADSVLELALAGNLQPPTKYTYLMTMQSGTLVFDQDVTLPSLTLGGEGLETTLILREGQDRTYTFADSRQLAGIVTQGNRVTIIQEGGTLTLGDATRSRPPLTLGAEETVIEVRGGTMTCATELTVDTAGTTTDITVAEGATLTLGKGLTAGTDGTTAALDLTVAGTLQLNEDLAMTPALRRTLTLAGGTIESTRFYPQEIHVICGDGGTADGEGLLDIVGGGTLKGSLTVDGISGAGTLTIEANATLKDLRDYTGTVSGAGRLEAITGSLGDVTLGDTWLANATGKKLGDVLTGWTEDGTDYHGAADFAGTIGFTAGTADDQKKLDFTNLDELTSLGMAFRINNYQHVIMRLDQYADAVIRWPDNPDGITLTLIESGAYGGELTLPHFPHVEGDEGRGVKFEFATFNPGGGYTVRTEGYTHGHTEDGVNDTLVWDNPVFTGEGAWIDIEFNGDTRNTGWFTLGDYEGNPVTTPDQRNRYNGLLAGDEPYVVLEQNPTTTPSITASHQADFVDSKHPAQAHGSLPLHYRPYVALSSLEYPEAWTVSLRLSAPDAARTCILALGHNYTGTTAGIPQYEGNVYTLIFATGDTPNEICLWVVPGVGEDTPKPDAPAFTVTLADATTAQHTFSVICDGTTLNLYVDGAWLGEQALPGEGARLTNGLQVGVQLGGTSIPTALQVKDFAVAATEAAGGSIDFLRFYKGAMPEAAMVEIADRTPYVRENLRYVRYVPAANPPEGGETWIQKDAWLEQTWDETKWVNKALVDQPAEGAECRILVAAGDHAIQVNVERQVEATAADGSVTNAGRYFYSPNRTYASLVVRAQDAATSAATLRLVPYGVTKPESGDTMNARPWETQLLESDWFKVPEPSTPGNRTGFRYGTLRFTGGASDPINDDPAIPGFHGAGYLIDAASVGVNGIYDAGVCYLSKYGNVELLPNGESPLLSRLTMVAGMSLTRGMVDEVARWQLTGPVVVQGTAQGTAEPGRDYALGHPELKTQDPNNDQASEDVWVPFFTANSTWKFYDDTRVEGGTDNANGAKTGLFARGVQTPGRLYLDFTATNGPATYQTTQAFSQQAWYRYGYEGNQDTTTEAGMPPKKASPKDYKQAVAFQIRLSSTVGNDNEVTLTLDELPTARVQTFHVEEEAGATKALTLKLERDKGVEALKVWKSVVAAARLDVSNNNTGVATATSGEGNALNLRPAEGIRTPVHRGNATHGHGAFIVGATEVDWDFGAASSVPRLEVIPGAELTFTVGQDFRRQDIGGITLVAQGKTKSTFPVKGSDAGPTPSDLTSAAWIHHRSADPFLGQDVELGEGAIFGFHAEAASSNADVQNEGVVLAGELRLTGNATLRADFESASGGAGAARLPHFVAAGGILATKSGLTLIVDAPTHQSAGGQGDGNGDGDGAGDAPTHQSAGGQGGTVDWHCHTATLTGDDFRLWKTGPGTMTFYANTPPSVTGKVTVEEGTLAVTAAADTPIGAKGLHVKAGATLADSVRMTGTTRRLARIPDGEFLSGGGTVAGRLGLKGGATYLAKQGEYLTADGGIFTDDSLEANINVTLPEGYKADTPYLVANRAERDVRRRLLPMKGTAEGTAEGTERWDAIAWIDNGTTTTYAARPPQVPAPRDYADNVPPDTIGGLIEKPLINQYQNAGHAYVGQTFGRTRAGNKKLNNGELSDALLCFTNISAFVSASKTHEGREYVDGTNFYVGYEFGISRQALVTIGDTEYVVLEVSVESVFDDGVSFPGVGFSDAQKAFEADFNGATVLSFKVLDAQGVAKPLDDSIRVEPVTGMDGKTLAGAGAAATPGKRWFRIPYQGLLDCELVKEDGNIRLRASASFSLPNAERLSTR